MVLGVRACAVIPRLREQQEKAARLQKEAAAKEQLRREMEKKEVSDGFWEGIEPPSLASAAVAVGAAQLGWRGEPFGTSEQKVGPLWDGYSTVGRLGL